jgi:DNA polymerase-3 subunit beta
LTEIEVQGETDGALSVPAKKIGDIIRELEELDITLESDESNRLQIIAGEGSYQLPGISAEDFPSLPEFEGAIEFSLPAETFSRLVQRTSFAVSRDELRPALTGVFFQLRPGELRAVSTDGHRLVRIIDSHFTYSSEPRELIIPVKAMEMIRKNLTGDEDVKLVIGANQLMAKLKHATLYSRLIEGKYPHYENVIPKDNGDRLVVGTDQLNRVVKRTQIFANPISRQVIFHLTRDQLTIQAEDVELGGKGKETLPATYTGEDKQIGYNSAYVLELLKQIESDEVLFELGSATSAGIVRPTEPREGEDFLMLIMPVRLN